MPNLFQHLNPLKFINHEMPEQVRHNDKEASYIIASYNKDIGVVRHVPQGISNER